MEVNKYPERTYQNWYEEVKKYFSKYEDSLPEQEVDRYLKSEEEKIKRDYKMNIGEFDRGEITEAQFWIGGVSAVANCLSLMYEPEETEELEEPEEPEEEEEPKFEKEDKLF